MSIKSKIISAVIKLTPTSLIKWIANIILKGIAELTEFSFDLEERKIYARVILCGEEDSIEVWLEDFAVIYEEESYKFILQHAKSNRLWLENLFSRIVGKAWKIPMLPQLAGHIELIAELFKAENPEQEEP